MYIIKLTDRYLYLYNQKEKKLIKEKISPNIIKFNKVYNVQKAIKLITDFIKKYDSNNYLFKTKIKFLLSKNLSPAEVFCYEYIFKALINVNYQIINEEKIIIDSKEIIVWDHILNVPSENIFIDYKELTKDTLKNKDYILVGYSDNLENIKKVLTDNQINYLEYENSDTILFERV